MNALYKDVRSSLSRIFAALPTPLFDDGRPDVGALFPLVDQLLSAGVGGFCVGGATGEYPCFDVEDRVRVFRDIGSHAAGRAPLIYGIGAENWRQVIHMAEVAQDAGAAAVLLPPPSYFDYNTRDLKQIFYQVAQEIQLPVLIYYIPQFTNSLLPSDAIDLVRSVGNIVGIKDSAGQRETLTKFSEAKQETDFVLMAGSDDLLVTALELKADGGISGTCSVTPQLVLGIYQALRRGDRRQAAGLQQLLQALVNAVSELPVPWGIKIALEAQGFSMGCCSWPAGPELKAKIAKFHRWLEEWIPTARLGLLGPDSFQLGTRLGER